VAAAATAVNVLPAGAAANAFVENEYPNSSLSIMYGITWSRINSFVYLVQMERAKQQQ
jgi:hypothetical protein